MPCVFYHNLNKFLIKEPYVARGHSTATAQLRRLLLSAVVKCPRAQFLTTLVTPCQTSFGGPDLRVGTRYGSIPGVRCTGSAPSPSGWCPQAGYRRAGLARRTPVTRRRLTECLDEAGGSLVRRGLCPQVRAVVMEGHECSAPG